MNRADVVNAALSPRRSGVIREEIHRTLHWEERHRRLISRIVIALGLTFIVDIIASFTVWALERNAVGTDIHGLGDAFFFSTAQLLTISSQMKNPVTSAGRVVDIALEVWAVVVVASLGGSFASFFTSGDSS